MLILLWGAEAEQLPPSRLGYKLAKEGQRSDVVDSRHPNKCTFDAKGLRLLRTSWASLASQIDWPNQGSLQPGKSRISQMGDLRDTFVLFCMCVVHQ